MILPSSYAATLAVILFGMLCWGSWPSFYKASGKTRFELYYFDFAIGLAVAAILCALTLGTLGFDGFSFMDDMLHAAKKQDLLGILAGALFNLGNMLLVASMAESGMAVAFPAGIGTAIIVASTWQYFLKSGENIALLLAGDTVIFFGVVICSAAYRLVMLSRVDDLVRTGQQKTTQRRASGKAVTLAILGGLILGSYLPVVSNAMLGDAGVGPYSLCVLFAIGALLSTFVFNLFFMNLPLSGSPLEILDYFQLTGRQHLNGLLGGAVWMFGLIASLVTASTEGQAVVGQGISFGLLQGSVVLAVIWGVAYWKEFKGADARINSMLAIMIALLVCGIGLIAVAPLRTGN